MMARSSEEIDAYTRETYPDGRDASTLRATHHAALACLASCHAMPPRCHHTAPAPRTRRGCGVARRASRAGDRFPAVPCLATRAHAHHLTACQVSAAQHLRTHPTPGPPLHGSCNCGPRVAVDIWLVYATACVQVWELVAESKAVHDASKVGRVCFDGLGSDAVSANGSLSATKHHRPNALEPPRQPHRRRDVHIALLAPPPRERARIEERARARERENHARQGNL